MPHQPPIGSTRPIPLKTRFPGGDGFAGERTYDRQLVKCGLEGETGATTTGNGRKLLPTFPKNSQGDFAEDVQSLSAGRVPPEFARLDNGDTLKLAEREEVLVDGDQDRCAGGDGRTENRDLLRITANVGREVSWHDRAHHPRQEAAQLTNFAFGKVELIAKFATEFLGNEVGNYQLMMRQNLLEECRLGGLRSCWHRVMCRRPHAGAELPSIATTPATGYRTVPRVTA